MQMIAVPLRKALSLRKFRSFAGMKSTENEDFPEKQECVAKAKNLMDAMYVLNGKWKFPLIFTLRQSPLRFNEILKLVEGITPKVLAKELRDLETNGLIKRKVIASTPVNIIYEATEYSDTLEELLRGLGQWGGNHREKIKQEMRDGNAESGDANGPRNNAS